MLPALSDFLVPFTSIFSSLKKTEEEDTKALNISNSFYRKNYCSSSSYLAAVVAETMLKEYKNFSYFKLALQSSIKTAEPYIQGNSFGVIYPDLYQWTYEMAQPMFMKKPTYVQEQSLMDVSFIENMQHIHRWIWLCPAIYSNSQLHKLLDPLFNHFKQDYLIPQNLHLLLVIPFMNRSTKQTADDLLQELCKEEIISENIKNKIDKVLITFRFFKTPEEAAHEVGKQKQEISENLQKMTSKEIEAIVFPYFAEQIALNPFS